MMFLTALLPKRALTKSCPKTVPAGAFPCHFKGLEGAGKPFAKRRIYPCISYACAAIPVGGDVAEWSKALPC